MERKRELIIDLISMLVLQIESVYNSKVINCF